MVMNSTWLTAGGFKAQRLFPRATGNKESG
jgi:hypothetical protein